MPARVFKYGVPPQSIRTFLILFALALTAPGSALQFILNRMAALEQAELERRVLQVDAGHTPSRPKRMLAPAAHIVPVGQIKWLSGH